MDHETTTTYYYHEKNVFVLDPHVKNDLHKKEENNYQIDTNDDKINNLKNDVKDNVVYTNNQIEINNHFWEKYDGKELKDIGIIITKNHSNH